MTCIADPDRTDYTDLLERHLIEVAEELRTIDLIDLVCFIQHQSYSALEDLLQSSTELFFKEGTLSFAWSADVELTWSELPQVRLGMEFQNTGVSVFFDLLLGAYQPTVNIGGILFDTELDHPKAGFAYLSEALASARLPRRIPLK